MSAHAEPSPVASTADSLRGAFDATFAVQPAIPEPGEDCLVLRLAEDPFLLRLAEIGGLFADRPLEPVPGLLPELQGIVSLRGQLVPIYDLGALLGYPPTTACRWFALGRGAGHLGLAFATLDAHVRLSHGTLAEADPATPATARPHVRGSARLAWGVCPILDMAAILATLTTRTNATRHPGSVDR